jgi:putative two-component system response regulator
MPATILLVVADRDIRDNWQELLVQQGYQIVGIGTGERAPDLCLHLQPDLVLIDASLPDVPGFEVCRRLKKNPRLRHTPVILITSFSDETYASRARHAGADDFWEPRPSRWEALTRVQALLQMKSYIDEQVEGVVLSLAQSIEARDPYTRGHSERISIIALKFGARIGLSINELHTLQVAGIVHDVGKVIIPDAILMKPGQLNFEERRIIRQHPIEGERICSPLKSLQQILPIVRHHHERMDGSGYPDGLSGERIPFAARVLQIADVYDALTSARPYRAARSLTDALATMYEEADRGWLDSDLLREFAPLAFAPKLAERFGIREHLRKFRLLN